jgi:cob(I)alamin adenosyltransferase
MPRITKVYTKKGDDGTTALGIGSRVPKDSLRVECYGTVDETNAAIGCAIAAGAHAHLAAMLHRIQNELFHLGSDLCVPETDKTKVAVPRIEDRHVKGLERDIDELQQHLPPLENFVLPGGSPAAAQLHLARTICRRAERILVTLSRKEYVGGSAIPYLNRLSDFLFVASRSENRARGVAEPVWDSRA